MGARIRALRQHRGLGQAELARAIRRLPQDVYKWEHGRPVPTEEVPAIAAALGVTICDLYGVNEGHGHTPAGVIRDRFIETVGSELTDIDLEFLAEIGASLERYRARLLREESQP